MPYINIWEPDGLYRAFTGEISGDEILESNFELHANPKYHNISYIIDDFTGATSCAIDINHLEILAKTNNIISMTKGNLKIALAVVDTEAIELAYAYKNITANSRFQCEIFLNLHDAKEWVK
jgi:hypothetical protein